MTFNILVSKSLPILRSRLGVFEFFLATPVTAALDDRASGTEVIPWSASVAIGIGGPWIRRDGMEEPRPVEMNVGEKKPHRPALGDFPSLVRIGLSALGAGARAVEKNVPRRGRP